MNSIYYSRSVLALVFASLLVGGCGKLAEINTARKSVETTARLKYILLALEDYHSVHKQYPDHLLKNHSWRVEIVDRIKHAEVSTPFDKTKPWDAAANKTPTESNVAAFTSLRANSQSSRFTSFVLVVDEGTVFHKEGVLSKNEIGDGDGDTAIILEIINSDIGWSEPRDIDIGQAISLIQSFPESLEARIGMANGQVSSISPKASAEEIRAIFLANDGKDRFDF